MNASYNNDPDCVSLLPWLLNGVELVVCSSLDWFLSLSLPSSDCSFLPIAQRYNSCSAVGVGQFSVELTVVCVTATFWHIQSSCGNPFRYRYDDPGAFYQPE
jgi:hypothetical protein